MEIYYSINNSLVRTAKTAELVFYPLGGGVERFAVFPDSLEKIAELPMGRKERFIWRIALVGLRILHYLYSYNPAMQSFYSQYIRDIQHGSWLVYQREEKPLAPLKGAERPEVESVHLSDAEEAYFETKLGCFLGKVESKREKSRFKRILDVFEEIQPEKRKITLEDLGMGNYQENILKVAFLMTCHFHDREDRDWEEALQRFKEILTYPKFQGKLAMGTIFLNERYSSTEIDSLLSYDAYHRVDARWLIKEESYLKKTLQSLEKAEMFQSFKTSLA